MIDSLTVGGILLEKDVPDVIDSENNLIYDLKTMTSSRLKDKKDMIDAIAIGGLCQPLIFGGIDFAKAPDYAGRATYWVVSYKYKTAGFKFCNIRSDFGGLVWRFQDYYGINLKDLPINYNFEMAKEFYKNWVDGLFNNFMKNSKIFINGLFGDDICTLADRRYMQYMQCTPGVQQEIFNWIFGGRINGKENICKNRRRYFYIARGTTKHV